MDNLIASCKTGETGKVFTVVLKRTDTDPDSVTYKKLIPHDLTGYSSMKMQVEKSNGTVVMDQVACVIDADPTTGRITCTTDITVAAHPGLVTGSHYLEFSGLNAAGKKRYWPVNAQAERSFGKMVITAGLT